MRTGIGIGIPRAFRGSGGASTFIDLTTWGTLSRASEGSYLTGAATTGSTAFLQWASFDVRRFEDRGDGNGQMLLLEGSRTNMLYPTERLSNIWTNPSGSTVTLDYAPGADGRIRATRLQTASGTDTPFYNALLGQTSGIDITGSVWVRSPTGTTSSQQFTGGGGGKAAVGNASTTTTWARAVMKRTPHASTTYVMSLGDGVNLTASGGIAAGARDQVNWGTQLEQASFASSYIRSTDSLNAAITRSADILSGPISTVPAAMVNGAFSFNVAPVFSSAEGIRHATDQTLFSFAEDDSERILFVVSGGSIFLRVVSGGATKVTSSALTFSAHQKLTVSVDAPAGAITVSGATTGNGTVTGTAWTRTAGSTMYVGSRQGGAQNAFVRIGPLSVDVSAKKPVLFMLGQSNMQVNNITAKILGQVQQTYPLAKKVEYCVGGTTLYADWNKTGGAAYANAIAAWNAAYAADPSLASYTPIIIWGQGETDSGSAGWTAGYAAGLPRLFNDIATDLPFFAGCQKIIHMLYPLCGIDTSPGHTQSADIRAAETGYQAANPSTTTTVETSDLVTYDTVHYDDASTTILAARDAAVVYALMGGP